MDRRTFLARLALSGAGLLVGDAALEAYDRLTWEPKRLYSYGPGVGRAQRGAVLWEIFTAPGDVGQLDLTKFTDILPTHSYVVLPSRSIAPGYVHRRRFSKPADPVKWGSLTVYPDQRIELC